MERRDIEELTLSHAACYHPPTMAIQFHCTACSKPIEIDDEWAAKTVICPYCRASVTSPLESSREFENGQPVASPLSAGSDGLQSTITSQTNHIAVVAVMLAVILILCVACQLVLYQTHGAEIEDFVNKVTALVEQGAGMLEATQEVLQLDAETGTGTIPDWMVAINLVNALSLAVWIATVVCALVGMRRAAKRPLAITAIVIAGVAPVIFCCGGFLVPNGTI